MSGKAGGSAGDKAEELFAELVEEMAPRGVKKGAMFGMACLKDPNGKAFAGLHGQELVVRLNRDSEQHAAAIAVPGSHLFDPMDGRPMKDWVCLPLAASEQWLPFTQAAREMPR